MKKLFLAFAASVMAFSVSAAELNVYASGLKAGSVQDGKVEISYLLNAPATALEIQLLNAEGTEVLYTIAVTDEALLTKGAHSTTIDVSPYSVHSFPWAIKASAAEVTALSADLLAEDTNYDFYQPRGLAVNVNPESPFFGQIYMGNSKSGIPSADSAEEGAIATPTGILVFDALLQQLGNYSGGVTWEADGWGPERIQIDDDGLVYLNDHGATTAGLWIMDPANPASDFVAVLDPAQRGVNFSGPTAHEIFGTGADRVLYTIDFVAAPGYILKYELGETLPYVGAPDTIISTEGYAIGNAYNSLESDGRGGFWISQNRAGHDLYPALFHVNSNWEKDYSSFDNQALFPAESGKLSARGVVNLNKDKTLLGLANNKQAAVYAIAWDEETGIPTLTELYRTGNIGSNVDAIAFDWANNLYVASASSERLHVFATPGANTTVTPAAKKYAIVLGGATNGLENVTNETLKVRKVIENGQVVIIKDGVRYNVLGIVIN